MNKESINAIDKRSLSFTFLITTLFSIMLFSYAIHAVLPANPVKLPYESKVSMIKWFPQGWGFFSKNPREDQFFAYNLKSGDSVFTFPNNRAENLFGLRRYGRTQGIEYGRIYAKLPVTAWEKCEENSKYCINSLKSSITVENDIPRPTLCGKVGIVNKGIVPWAWSKNSRRIEMPSKVMKVNIICSKK